MTDPFASRMADLDALVRNCVNAGVFGSGIVRDTSNRIGRDWPWWSVQVEHTKVDGAERRRKTAEIRLNSPAPGVPSAFKGNWIARIWCGENSDRFTARGDRCIPWTMPSAEEFERVVAELLREADDALAKADCRDRG